MTLNHDEIWEMLPEYAGGALSSDRMNAVEAHLKGCQHCSETLSLLSGLQTVKVPDPGDLFWKTLPQKVRVFSKEKKACLFSIKPAWLTYMSVAAIVIVVISAFIYLPKKEMTKVGPLSKDPLAVSVLDYSGITESDIPEVSEPLPVGEIYPGTNYSGYGYCRELVSLSPGDIDNFEKILGMEEKNGG